MNSQSLQPTLDRLQIPADKLHPEKCCDITTIGARILSAYTLIDCISLLAKNRNGATGICRVVLEPTVGGFSDKG